MTKLTVTFLNFGNAPRTVGLSDYCVTERTVCILVKWRHSHRRIRRWVDVQPIQGVQGAH